jgi:hypothetical protein
VLYVIALTLQPSGKLVGVCVMAIHAYAVEKIDLVAIALLITVKAIAVCHGVADGDIVNVIISASICEYNGGDEANYHAKHKQHSQTGPKHSRKICFHKIPPDIFGIYPDNKARYTPLFTIYITPQYAAKMP